VATLHAKTALLPDGWARDVSITIDAGKITAIETGVAAAGDPFDCLLPAMVNLHSHSFQRSMAGLTEYRSSGSDSFWTWRALMYQFLEQLTPDDVEAIAAMVMVEMAEAGFAGVGEFHYLHHAPGGAPYVNPAEMSARIAAAAQETGLGLTLLPVLYQRGGCDGRALSGGQLRFGCDGDRFQQLWHGAKASLRALPDDAVLSVAPHSLRAVDATGLHLASQLAPNAPVHIHVAEQRAEVDEVLAATGARPVEWLLHNTDLSPRWCLIHATQMLPFETTAMAQTGAVAGLCPITEANLGDGIFDGPRFLQAGGRFGIGSDSNVRISLSEELRLLEYGQRLQTRSRAVFAVEGKSTGRMLYQGACQGGAIAAGRASGAIAVGQWADLLALDCSHPDLAGREGDMILDSFIFARDDRIVSDVWSAGRHIVTGGRHWAKDQITARYAKTTARLRGLL
jgi:formimidoylglutamate deiminase